MSALTPKGVPYALDTDLRRDWPATSQAVANWADTHVPRGMAAATVGVVFTNSSEASATVTWPASRFTVAPVVVATKVTSAGIARLLIVQVTANGSSSTTVSLYHPAGTAVTGTVNVHLIAVQMSTGSATG